MGTTVGERETSTQSRLYPLTVCFPLIHCTWLLFASTPSHKAATLAMSLPPLFSSPGACN